MTRSSLSIVTLGLLLASGPARAEDAPAPSRAPPASYTAISPIFGQLVSFSTPIGFVPAFENTKDAFYIREAVPRGETAQQWTQMITVTGARGAATNPNFNAQGLAAAIAGGFKKACPETFAAKGFGATKFGEQDGYVAVAGCGKLNSSADGHSETALIIAVKGSTDGYTIQWAERGPQQATVAMIDEAKWQGRLRALMPIRLCPIVPGEAAPYPSCVAGN
jgi:hypothetical protein